MIYYVSTTGSDRACGDKDAPFQTINRAASVAVAGDVIRVHGGVYREWVNPVHGGTSEHKRIVYEAVEGEHPVIKGSEAVTGWEKVKDTVWKATVPNSLFGDWNPYALEVEGDWFVIPKEYRVHLGDVYINGVSMFEGKSMDDLYDDTPRIIGCQTTVKIEDELILHPELTLYKWYSVVEEETTTIYGNFREYDPNKELIEINVRPCCFYPKETGVNYITLRGFEIAHGASPWTPPTSHQIGMVGPHWSKGWIIENNDIHDAKCSGISLGKEERTGHNLHSRFRRKSPHRYQLEAVFAACRLGWSKDTIGSHIVRNNEIHDCGQNGIVGHLGCAFSRIEHNHIYNIGVKHEYWGHELGAIKFHAAIDTLIYNNNIHTSVTGMWLDWQAQGMRVCRNLFYDNNRDFMLEVTHGPILIDHNIFLSHNAFDNWAQGSAMVHNLYCGKIRNTAVMKRNTPYHLPHSTAVAGFTTVNGGDDRYYNNMFVGKWADTEETEKGGFRQFLVNCDKYISPEEYATRESVSSYTVWLKDNAYAGYSVPSKHEQNSFIAKDCGVEITRQDGKVFLTLDIPEEFAKASCEPVCTERLGETRNSEAPFDAPDGSDYDLSFDLIGEKYGDVYRPGPLASIKAGKQTVCVWSEKE